MSDPAAPPVIPPSADDPPGRADAPPVPRRRSGAWLALGSLLASLLAAELMLRIFHPLPDPYAQLKQVQMVSWPGSAYVPSAFPPNFRRRMRAEPGLPGMDTAWRSFSTNNLGFRGDALAIPKPPGELRVFVVGGSTTECLLLDDREAVTARLQAYLRAALPGVDVRVYGAGKSGDKSWDHVAMAAHRIAHLQPDVIVVFAGVNDVLSGVAGRDYLLRPEEEKVGTARLVKMALTELQLPRLAQAALNSPDPRTMATTSGYRRAVRFVAALPLTPLPRRPDPRPYAENLATLAGVARAHGTRMVMMTQATTWTTSDPVSRRWHWMLGSQSRHPEPDLDAAMTRYNAAMLDVGRAQGVPVFDLAAGIPRTSGYFYDDVHFNVRGADTAARMLAEFMVRQGVVAAPRR